MNEQRKDFDSSYHISSYHITPRQSCMTNRRKRERGREGFLMDGPLGIFADIQMVPRGCMRELFLYLHS